MRSGVLVASLLLLGWPAAVARAEGTQLSSERLDLLDQRGYFTPAFKKAVHELLQTEQEAAAARAKEAKCRAELPELRRQSAEAAAQTEKLRHELELYTHPEEGDFDLLQAAMANPAATSGDRLKLAQAFIWSYPTDSHQAEAQAYLQQTQKVLSDEKQAEAAKLAARQAARALLVKRAKARELTLPEWQNFLQSLSQVDLLSYLGQPQQKGPDYWIYTGKWVLDPATNEPVGLRVNFNGSRVLSVVPTGP